MGVEKRVVAAMTSQQLEKRLNILQWVILVLLAVVIVVPFIITSWISSQLPVVSTVEIENVKIVGMQELCPGDPLVYSYSFHARGTGVLVRDRVLWRVTPPPKTMVFSVSRRFILAEPIDQELTEAWHIPTVYINPETDQEEPIPPGDYRLLFAISSPSRSTVIAIASVDFTIKDCPL